MYFGRHRFNIYLLTLLCAALVGGCKSSPKEQNIDPQKLDAKLAVYGEAQEKTTFTKKISVIESSPVEIVVDQTPILTTRYIKHASVVEAVGGFAMQIKFDQTGQWLLDHFTALNIGRHLVIYAEFGVAKEMKNRWIAGPTISGRIADGILLFTPDTTREEADQIVLGLKNRITESNKPLGKW